MAFAVERLGTGSSQEEIARAIQESLAQMISEGIPEDQARAQATRIARERTGGGNTKLVRSRSVGALPAPGSPGAGADAGLTGSSGPSGSGFSFGSGGGRFPGA